MSKSEIIKFVLQQILFLCVFALYIYLCWIRPKRIKKRNAKDPKNTIEIGDEIVTEDGLVGIVAIIKDNSVVIESGSFHNRYNVEKKNIYYNINANERSKEAYKKLPFIKKVLYHI